MQAHFNLLFHAVVGNFQAGFNLLLDHGLDPTWANRSGNTVLLPLARRGLTTWAETCLNMPDMTESKKKDFLNKASDSGEQRPECGVNVEPSL